MREKFRKFRKKHPYICFGYMFLLIFLIAICTIVLPGILCDLVSFWFNLLYIITIPFGMASVCFVLDKYFNSDFREG